MIVCFFLILPSSPSQSAALLPLKYQVPASLLSVLFLFFKSHRIFHLYCMCFFMIFRLLVSSILKGTVEYFSNVGGSYYLIFSRPVILNGLLLWFVAPIHFSSFMMLYVVLFLLPMLHSTWLLAGGRSAFLHHCWVSSGIWDTWI